MNTLIGLKSDKLRPFWLSLTTAPEKLCTREYSVYQHLERMFLQRLDQSMPMRYTHC